MINSVQKLEIEKSLGLKLDKATALGGGCINNVQKVETSKGHAIALKTNTSCPSDFFRAEAEGLNALKHAKTDLRIPEVLGYGQNWIALEFIPQDSHAAADHESLGRGLALLHHYRETFFGWNSNNYIGSLSQENGRYEEFVPFFVEKRLKTLSKRANSLGFFSADQMKQFESLYQKLDVLVPKEKPALLHGDLWSGNAYFTTGGAPVIIDPAVYYGHREIDLGMTRLFGGFSKRFYDAYLEAFPLEEDWEARLDLYNLYPLLVHVLLFGSSYTGQINRILRRFLP